MSVLSRKYWDKLYSRIPGFIKNNIGRKLSAILFTGFIFFLYYYAQNTTEKLMNFSDIPVTIQLPEGYELIGKQPSVSVTVKRGLLSPSNIEEKDISLELEPILEAGKTVYAFSLSAKDFNTPFGASVKDFQPKQIGMTIEKRISLKLKVEAVYENRKNLPEGYDVTKTSFIPDEVVLTGPESQIKKIRTVRTSPIPLDAGITSSFTMTVPLALPEKTLFTVSPDKVLAAVNVTRSHITKTFRSIPVRLLCGPKVGTRSGVEISSASAVDITVDGIKAEVEKLSIQDLKPYADVSGITKIGLHKDIEVKCSVEKPGIKLRTISPASVSVIIGKNSQ